MLEDKLQKGSDYYNNQMFGGSFGNQSNAGGGLFGNQNAGNSQNNMAGNQGGSIFGGGQSNAGGIFGNQNATQNQGGMMGGNVFGGNNTQQGSQGVGMFGAASNQNTVFGGNTSNQGGVFGNAAGGNVFGGQQNQNQSNPNSIFGGNTSNTGGGVFGNAQNQNQGGGTVFGNANNSFKPNTFGSNPVGNTGGVFGNTSGFGTNTGGVFGNASNNTGNTVFGNQSNNQNAGTVFGNATNNTFSKGTVFGGNTSAFGANTFGGSNPNPAFGNNSNPQSGGIFGNAQNNASTPFGASSNTVGSIFGANQPQQQPNVFGGANNTAFTNNPNPAGGNIFNNAEAAQVANTGSIFGGGNNAQGASIFGKSNTTAAFGAPINTAQSNNSFNFGNNSLGNQPNSGLNTGFVQTNLGNTTWGVPTNNQPINKFTPLKPKNTKIDGKHVVKCIVLLDENLNFCKNQLRIRYIMSGGSSQPPVASFSGFGGTSQANPNIGFNNTSGFAAPNTFQNNAQTAAGGSSIFGGGNTNAGMFGGQPSNQSVPGGLFGQAQSQPATNTTGGLFGNANTNTGLFGANTQNQNNTGFKPAATGGLFGNTAPSTPAFGGATTSFGATQPSQGLFGGNAPSTAGGLFGGQSSTQQTPTTPMFGGSPGFNTQPQTGGLFGQTQPATGGLFGNPQSQPQTGGLFGQTQPQTGGLFGGANQTSQGGLFGQTQSASGGLFGATAQLSTGAPTSQQTGGLFGAQTQAFGTNLVSGFLSQTQSQPQSQPSMFGSFQPPMPPTNPNAEVATLILNGLFNTDFFKQMMNGTASTPYEDLVNSVKKKNYNISFDDKYEGLNNYTNSQNSRPSKFNRAMYNSTIDFHHSPYLYSDNLLNANTNTYSQFDNLNEKLRRLNDKFQPKPAPFKMIKQKEISNNSNNVSKILPKNFTSQITQKFPLSSKANPNNNTHDDQLPIIAEGYKITPTLRQLKQKTPQELKRIPNVIIQNEYGKIKFKRPINLYKKKIAECIQIMQDSIQIIDDDWDKKKCELFFYNFGHYTDLKSEPQKSKMERKMRRWIEKNNMYELNFDKNKGELQVQIYSE